MLEEQRGWMQPGMPGMVVLSLLLHLALVSALFLAPRFLGKRTFYAPPVYTVSLVSPAEVRPAKSKPAAKPRIQARKRAAKPKMTWIAKKKRAKKKKARIREEQRLRKTLEEIRKRVARRPAPKAPPAPVSGVVTRENLDLRFKAYYNQIWQRVREAWVLPESLVQRRLETIIGIRIGRSGVIHRTWTEKSSGNPVFDQSALRAVAKVNPLPPLPPEFRGEYLEVGLRFTPDDR